MFLHSGKYNFSFFFFKRNVTLISSGLSVLFHSKLFYYIVSISPDLTGQTHPPETYILLRIAVRRSSRKRAKLQHVVSLELYRELGMTLFLGLLARALRNDHLFSRVVPVHFETIFNPSRSPFGEPRINNNADEWRTTFRNNVHGRTTIVQFNWRN